MAHGHNDSLTITSQRALTGRADYVRDLDNASSDTTGNPRGMPVSHLGPFAAPSTKQYYIKVEGASSCDIINKPTTFSGTTVPSATVQPCLVDDVTVDPTTAATNLTMGLNTANKNNVAVPPGCRFLLITVTVPAGAALAFNNGGLFEYRCK